MQIHGSVALVTGANRGLGRDFVEQLRWIGAEAASKAAAWSLTNSVRLELAPQGTLVTGLLMGSTDTDTVAGLDIPKNDPADVVRAALDGVEAGSLEVVADEETAATKQALATDPAEVYRALLA